MTKRIAAALITGFSTSLTPLLAQAQNTPPPLTQQQIDSLRWIQIEAQPNLSAAETSLRGYAGRLEGVNGFRLSGTWYGIILGPYSEQAAEVQLRSLKNAGLIPRDSFIVQSRDLRQQFWPVGANALNQAAQTITNRPAPDQSVADQPAVAPVAPVVQAEPQPPRDETKREALQSERLLDRDARKALQVALKWGDYYQAAIDGAFGAGTRRSMAAWQGERGYDPTGVLTTRQRTELLNDYQSVITSLGLQTYSDLQAGISLTIPGAMVAFDRYEAPFVHFKTKTQPGPRLVLISQSGDQATLYGLYDILQSLEIVPVDGPRERKKTSFTIEGSDEKITSHTQARLVDGTVKGFTLIWPQGDEKRRDRVLREMKNSFASLGPQALADDAGLDNTTQSLDLLSGLEIRAPERSRSGFYVDKNGAVLTSLEAVQNCGRVSLNGDYDAHVVATDDTQGLALLRAKDPLAPIAYASFLSVDPRLKSDLAVAGYSYEGRLNAPSLTFGQLAELTGLHGEANLNRLALSALPGDAGGPVLDAGGTVTGLLLPRIDTPQRSLPEGVSFALKSAPLVAFVHDNGINPVTVDTVTPIDPVDLSARAADMTVLVSCWK